MENDKSLSWNFSLKIALLKGYAKITVSISLFMIPTFRLLPLITVLTFFGSVSPTIAAVVKRAPPARITYVKGATPLFLGDYPHGSMQIMLRNQPIIITAPGIGGALSNVSVPSHPKNKDLVYLSVMTIGGKNIPTSAIYEYSLKNKKARQIFSEKNINRKLRIVGIDGNNLLLVQAAQAIEQGCASLWTGQYRFVSLDLQKPKIVKPYPISAALKKLGESEEQGCKQTVEFKK